MTLINNGQRSVRSSKLSQPPARRKCFTILFNQWPSWYQLTGPSVCSGNCLIVVVDDDLPIGDTICTPCNNERYSQFRFKISS
jgi:hypothetical protein